MCVVGGQVHESSVLKNTIRQLMLEQQVNQLGTGYSLSRCIASYVFIIQNINLNSILFYQQYQNSLHSFSILLVAMYFLPTNNTVASYIISFITIQLYEYIQCSHTYRWQQQLNFIDKSLCNFSLYSDIWHLIVQILYTDNNNNSYQHLSIESEHVQQPNIFVVIK